MSASSGLDRKVASPVKDAFTRFDRVAYAIADDLYSQSSIYRLMLWSAVVNLEDEKLPSPSVISVSRSARWLFKIGDFTELSL